MTATEGREDTTLPDLLARIADGDSAAFAEFYDRTGDRVYGMILRVLRDPGYSEETAQEVFLQVWRSADKFDPAAGSALSWLITLAHRRAVDRVRSEVAGDRRETTYSQATATVSFDQVADAVEVREARERVINCLGSLTDIQRESVSLAYYRGLTYREVAEELSVALPTIKSRIRDGLARLRECLGDRDV
ncbi:ECF RNA polymerase sigma factor SigK [Gordonia oryzae]|uniref:ECF RNA polymerase sigma factor SigK n=1 Tax=Gordonia oryzae TaxID=2487349 RepID=UPI00160824EE|nr:ECF RNA polymerase sigma factor SigK [Gordonia oryzae]